MKNSDSLRFDYTLPPSELPHDYYMLYVKNKEFTYDWFQKYTKKDLYQLPLDLDRFYYPENTYFLVVGKSKRMGDQVLDGGNILQETARYTRKRLKNETLNN